MARELQFIFLWLILIVPFPSNFLVITNHWLPYFWFPPRLVFVNRTYWSLTFFLLGSISFDEHPKCYGHDYFAILPLSPKSVNSKAVLILRFICNLKEVLITNFPKTLVNINYNMPFLPHLHFCLGTWMPPILNQRTDSPKMEFKAAFSLGKGNIFRQEDIKNSLNYTKFYDFYYNYKPLSVLNKQCLCMPVFISWKVQGWFVWLVDV